MAFTDLRAILPMQRILVVGALLLALAFCRPLVLRPLLGGMPIILAAILGPGRAVIIAALIMVAVVLTGLMPARGR